MLCLLKRFYVLQIKSYFINPWGKWKRMKKCCLAWKLWICTCSLCSRNKVKDWITHIQITEHRKGNTEKVLRHHNTWNQFFLLQHIIGYCSYHWLFKHALVMNWTDTHSITRSQNWSKWDNRDNADSYETLPELLHHIPDSILTWNVWCSMSDFFQQTIHSHPTVSDSFGAGRCDYNYKLVQKD